MNPNPFLDITRRQFLGRASTGIGAAALASLLNPKLSAAQGVAGIPHFAPKAKRVIWLTQAGAPSQLDLFDYKPGLRELFDKDLPASVRNGQRVTGMTSGQARFPIAPSVFNFKQHGNAGHWLSELLPHTARLADDLCVIRSMHTEAINHDPAMTMLQTGSQVAGRPSFGSWMSYGLGSENAELPAFVVMISRPSGNGNAQPLHERMWSSGFLPSRYQGVRFSSGKDPVLFLTNPPGITPERRRAMLDDIAGLNKIKLDEYQDPEIQARIDQYEMAFRMQSSVPELADLSKEPASVFERYGPESRAGHLCGKLRSRAATCRAWCAIYPALSSRMGPAQRFAGTHPHAMLRHRPAKCRACRGLETTRNAGGHAGDLGWRVRAQRLFARAAHREDLRSRSSPALLLYLARRGRCKARRDRRRDG